LSAVTAAFLETGKKMATFFALADRVTRPFGEAEPADAWPLSEKAAVTADSSAWLLLAQAVRKLDLIWS
jgi:hypothetical protein